MTTDLCRIVVFNESDFGKYFPFYPKPESGSAYAWKLDLIVLLIPEYRVENNKAKIIIERKQLEIDIVDLIVDLVDHECMHMILYHLEGVMACKKLDGLTDLRLLNRIA